MFIVGNYYLLILTAACFWIQKPSSSYAAAQQQYYPKSINSSCSNPCACGNIHTISYPFRLKDDPEYCGHPDRAYEISCENNTTASLYLDNYKYHVRAINYRNYTIRLADPSIKNNDSCSFPTYFPNWKKLMYYDSFRYSGFSIRVSLRAITFVSCPFPLNDSLFIDTNQCVSLLSSNNTSIVHRYTYMKAGYMDPNDTNWDMCRIDRVVMTSSLPSIYKDENNDLSLLKVHESLVYGFELSWPLALCDCKEGVMCWFDEIGNTIVCGSLDLACKNSYKMLGEGYVAPELINRSIGGVSYKADVYSFGMLLVELVGLKRGLAANDDNSSTKYFPHWIYDCLNKGTDIEIAKTDDIDDDSMGKITRRMTIVALWCIQMSPDDRPSMSKVLEMLESDVELLQMPPQPAESDDHVAKNEDKTWGTYSTSDHTALLYDDSSLSQDL